jgi:hypothetical protein
MATRNSRTSAPWRLRRGESILSAARAIDTNPVKARLKRFERAHQDYAGAHQKVETAEAQLRTTEIRVETCDAVQDKAVAALTGALIADGQPFGNALAPFGALPISKLTRLPFAKEAKAVHELVAAVQRDGRLKPATLEAAEAADKAARAVEQALVPLQKMQQGVREARRMRDVRAQAWDAALAALRHDAQAAARDGMPQVYAALFPPSRPSKAKTTTVNAPPVTQSPAAPAPPATETPNAA